MDQKAKMTSQGQAVPVRRSLSQRFTDWYGGGAFSVERHTTETIGGSRGFSRDKPAGRLASRSRAGRTA